MKPGDLVDFVDHRGNQGTGIVKRIRSESLLDLSVKRGDGRFQTFLSVPKTSQVTKIKHLAAWSVIKKEVTKAQKDNFKKDKEHKKETFSSNRKD